MTPTRPYFLRAVYDWIVDNDCTPYVVVNTEAPSVEVPLQYVENGQITLNLSPTAVVDLFMDNHLVQFSAKFGGVSHNISVPINAVLGIYAKENGQGMTFPSLEDIIDEDSSATISVKNIPLKDIPAKKRSVTSVDSTPEPPKKPNGKPSLKVVK